MDELDRSDNVGKLPDLHARALDILGATGRDSVERFDSRGESRPASVEDRLSGVELSILELEGEAVGDAPRMRVRGKKSAGQEKVRKVGGGRVVGSGLCPSETEAAAPAQWHYIL
jgi:hypothetical protein